METTSNLNTDQFDKHYNRLSLMRYINDALKMVVDTIDSLLFALQCDF